MKIRIALLLVTVVLLLFVLTVSLAEMDYGTVYETAIQLAGNDLSNIQNLNDAVEMLSQTGSYSFSRSYLVYFQQIAAVQAEDPEIETIILMFEICKDIVPFNEDLEARKLPSCADLIAYAKARALEQDGKLLEACSAYRTMFILDAPDRAIALALMIGSTISANPTPEPVISGVSVGNYITFGHYPQTAAGTDRTPIEWLVLEVQDNKALVISHYGLDVKPYNTEWAVSTWENCTLRTWLNNDFLYMAFTDEERSAIIMTNVNNNNNQGYNNWSTSGGNDTQDKIFLLSFKEAKQYFGVEYSDIYDATHNKSSRVGLTAYAIAQGAWNDSERLTSDGTAAGWWWLRSPGSTQTYAAVIYTGGALNEKYVSHTTGSVRPAFWLGLDIACYQ